MKQSHADTKRQLYFTFYSTSQFVLAVSSAQKPQVTLVAITVNSAGLDYVHMGCCICVHIRLFWESEKREKQRMNPGAHSNSLIGQQMNARYPHGKWQKVK